jgi:hypothetical protein
MGICGDVLTEVPLLALEGIGLILMICGNTAICRDPLFSLFFPIETLVSLHPTKLPSRQCLIAEKNQ